jgi:hypothetical protein
MVIYMSDKKIETLDDIRAFLEGTVEVEFSIADKGECCLSRLFREILYLWFSGPFIDWNRLSQYLCVLPQMRLTIDWLVLFEDGGSYGLGAYTGLHHRDS